MALIGDSGRNTQQSGEKNRLKSPPKIGHFGHPRLVQQKSLPCALDSSTWVWNSPNSWKIWLSTIALKRDPIFPCLCISFAFICTWHGLEHASLVKHGALGSRCCVTTVRWLDQFHQLWWRRPQLGHGHAILFFEGPVFFKNSWRTTRMPASMISWGFLGCTNPWSFGSPIYTQTHK